MEALLLRLAYVSMVTIIIVGDLVAAAISFKSLGRLSRSFWVTCSVVLLFVLWFSERERLF